MEIIPAIIPHSFHDLEDYIRDVKDMASIVQIDVLDGKHVPEKSWPYKIARDPDFEKIKQEGEGMPFWQDVQFEVDLMIQKPEEAWRDWMHAGASRVIVHLESTDVLSTIISEFKEENVAEDSLLCGQIGVAIQVTTDNEKLYPLLEDIDFVQCMGIEHIGYQGQEFDERVIAKIKDIKNRKPEMVVSVDGAMNEKTIPLVRDAGAERVAVGSALFESENIKKTYQHLTSL